MVLLQSQWLIMQIKQCKWQKNNNNNNMIINTLHLLTATHLTQLDYQQPRPTSNNFINALNAFFPLSSCGAVSQWIPTLWY